MARYKPWLSGYFVRPAIIKAEVGWMATDASRAASSRGVSFLRPEKKYHGDKACERGS